MVLLRAVIGDVLRRHRVAQTRTLRDVSQSAGVSLGYLSEVERGRKEASSELLTAICQSLDVELSEMLREVSEELARIERRARLAPIGFSARLPDVARVPVESGSRGLAPVRPIATLPSTRPGADPRRPGPARESGPTGPGRDSRPARRSSPTASLGTQITAA